MRDYVTVAFDTLFKSTVMPIFKADIQARYSGPIEKSDIFIQGRFKNIPPMSWIDKGNKIVVVRSGIRTHALIRGPEFSTI